jgi:hypothetical protein
MLSAFTEESPIIREAFENELKWCANSVFAASLKAISTTMDLFLLAMVNYPEKLQKAQAEIDCVTEGKRLPTFSDRPKLPYGEYFA